MTMDFHNFQSLILLLAALAQFGCVDSKLVHKTCSARWDTITAFENRLWTGAIYKFSYRVGLLSSPSAGRQLQYPEKAVEWLERIDVKLPPTHPGPLDAQLSHSALTNQVNKSSQVTVMGKESRVFVQQLVVESQGSVFGVDMVTVTAVPPLQPSAAISCVATYNERELISSSSRVRFKHESTGQYMVLTIRKGWDAATLGYSQGYHFQITDIGSAKTRITTVSPSFNNYKYLYSSTFGGIYFDLSDASSDKQWWYLSNPNPRDGDLVTIRSVNWPTAYIIRYEGSSTNVFCEYTTSPDRWIIELAN